MNETKMKQLETIEKELGIDLITLFKALKNGFYCVRLQDYVAAETCALNITEIKGIEFIYEGVGYCVSLSEYGVVWALTKGELKNE